MPEAKRPMLACEYKALPKVGPPGNSEYTPYLPKPENKQVICIILLLFKFKVYDYRNYFNRTRNSSIFYITGTMGFDIRYGQMRIIYCNLHRIRH